MNPVLPLQNPSVRDICESLDHLHGEAPYGESVFKMEGSQLNYHYNNDTIILVDTSVTRTIRFTNTLNGKRRVVVKDITGQAHQNPIVLAAIDGAKFEGYENKEQQLAVPWIAVELVGEGDHWTIKTHKRVTSLDLVAYKLPQNLNMILPPPEGGKRQFFPTVVKFPKTVKARYIVPSRFNGLSMADDFDKEVVVEENATFTQL